MKASLLAELFQKLCWFAPVRLRAQSKEVLALCILAVPLAVLALRSEGLDFRAYFVAAKATATHLDPYQDNQHLDRALADGRNEQGMSRWIYPPPALFFALPLRWLSFSPAKILFDLTSIAALLWIIQFLGESFRTGLRWKALALLSIPVIACVQRGQVDILILLCLVLAWRFQDRYVSGVLLGIAITIKVFPAALLLWWLLEKRFREAAVAVLFTVGVGTLATWCFGLSSYASFLHNLTTLHAQTVSSSQAMASWISLSPGFVGSYNNPLVFFNNAGSVAGLLLTLAGGLLLRYKRVDQEAGFFSMVLLSQAMNTTLWTMGMVMYIPFFLLAVGRMRPAVSAVLWLAPLYLPSQLRILGVTPRLLIAFALVGWFAIGSAITENATEAAEDLDSELVSV